MADTPPLNPQLYPPAGFANTREDAEAIDRAIALQDRIQNGDSSAQWRICSPT
jgi:hypothetical protein